MRASSSSRVALRTFSVRKQPFVCRQCRAIQISASPATESPKLGNLLSEASTDGTADSADARFEVLGSPYSLLSVKLSASQKLYTRRGTLVTVAGKVQNAQSTLSLLSPISHSLLGKPFLYQRITSTTPLTALIATSAPNTTLSILHLDGTTDWQIANRNALLAWTGHTLAISPRLQRGLGLAYWGQSHLTGRGMAALSATGQIYQVHLAEGEEMVVHPSHVVAYSIGRNPLPAPYRLKSSSLRLQIPGVPASLVPAGWAKFAKDMRETNTYKNVARFLFSLRTMTRRSIWGDRLFVQFRGPTTILMSSRGARIRDVLSREQVDEIADTEAGVVFKAIEGVLDPKEGVNDEEDSTKQQKAPVIHYANVGTDGKVHFEDTKDLKDVVSR